MGKIGMVQSADVILLAFIKNSQKEPYICHLGGTASCTLKIKSAYSSSFTISDLT